MLDMNNSGNKNIKDTSRNTSISIKDIYTPFSYTKTNKLITALYMVTDIIEKDEPIRNKLRTLGTEIISDPSTPFDNAQGKSLRAGMSMRIEQIVSFLDIASAMNFISQMNCAILKKEFLELREAVLNSTEIRPVSLAEFLGNFQGEEIPLSNLSPHRGRRGGGTEEVRGELNSKGHARIGVQKGSTLLKAIKDMSNRIPVRHDASFRPRSIRSRAEEFDILKKKRRDDILNFIKKNGGSATITDIKNNTVVQGSALHNISGKTLQRELMSMTKDGVLYREGLKRWSKYFVK